MARQGHTKRLRARILATALLLPPLLAGPALAQLRTPDQAEADAGRYSPAGRWRFATAEMASACTMSGEMTVNETRNGYACTFTAFQTCTAGAIQKIRTTQTCTLERRDGKLHISSKLEKIVSVEPAIILDMVKAGYAPDNFILGMNALGDTMSGLFLSIGQAPVTFVRVEENVS